MSAADTMSERRRMFILINLLITNFSSSLLATALVVALPKIAEEMQITLTTAQWVTSGFTLASAIVMPLSAYLITRIATRKLYLGSLIAIIVGLSVCATASTFSVMIGGRVLQAASGGVLGAMAQVILLTVYPKEQHGTIMGWYGLAVGTAPIFAPTVAGILMDLSSWRMVFWASVVLMVLSYIFALFVFDDFLPTKLQKFDMISFLYSALAFGGITLGVGNITNFGIGNPFSYVPLFIGIISAVLFAHRQIGLTVPLLDLKLLQNRIFRLAVISGMLHSFVMMGAAIMMPTYVQMVHNYNATQAGLFMVLPCICFAAVSPYAGKVYDKIGIKQLYIYSALGLFISSWAMAFVTEHFPVMAAMGLYCIRNGSLGLLMMPLTVWGMGAIGKENAAQGTALMNSLRNVSGAIGSATVIGFMGMVTQWTADSPHAVMYGFNGAFAFVGVFTIFMLVIALFFVKPGKETE